MSFIIKIISAILIIATLYLLAVFFVPTLADNIANSVGVPNFNQKIRGFKSGADTVGDSLMQIKSAEEHINSARQQVDNINKSIDETKKVVDQKIDQTTKVIDQTNKTIDSVKKTTDEIGQLKKNINDLSSVTGSTD